MALLRITLLGGLEISGYEETRSAPLTKKAKALLAYLALRGDAGQSREKLAGIFWGDSAEKQARANLRQALSSVRQILNGADEAVLIADAERVSLRTDALELDVAAFERLAADANPEALSQAAQLYRGDLLDGFSLREEPFEAWAMVERERLRILELDVLSKLIAHCEERADTERCIGLAVRLLSLDPLRESAHRCLMKAYAAQGRHALALKQFEICRETLRQQLQVQPDAETASLYTAIREKRSATNSEPARCTEEVGDAIPSLPEGPSVAVIPFENASGDAADSYFADGLTENIIASLTRFRELLVIGFKSALKAREWNGDLRELGMALGVAHILRGSVYRADQRFRITAQLIDANTGQGLWAQKYDCESNDVFAIQDEISQIIVATIAGRIEQRELGRSAGQPAENLVAYDCILRGRQALNLYTQKGEIAARRFFERALKLEPENAAALAGLAISHIHEYEATWSEFPKLALENAYLLARKAVGADDADSSARYAIASACFYRGEHELAKVHIERALELNPIDYHNLCAKGWFLAFSDTPELGVECSLQAMRLNPLAPDNCLFTIGMAEYVAGRYEEALKALGKTRGWGLLRPAWIAACYAQLGRTAQAAAAADEVRGLVNTDRSISIDDDDETWRGYWLRLIKFENGEARERFLEGLRKAGLPA